MCVILPLVVRSVKLEGKSCGSVVDNSTLHLRSVLRAHDLEIVERSLRIVQLVLQLHLALDQLPDLAVDLAQLLDHHRLEELLTQLRHGLDRTGATRALARLGGGIVRSVDVALAHVCHSTFRFVCCQAGRLRLWTGCG